MYDFLVAGKGLFGSAAARYLSQHGRVAIIGPDEPSDPASHAGPFASHYDQGRITGWLGRDALWSHLAWRSIARYRELEEGSGTSFYTANGRLHVPAERLDPRFVEGVAQERGLRVASLDANAVAEQYPYLRFPPAAAGLFEPAPAGWINPRDMIKAQLQIAAQQGATVIADVVEEIGWKGQRALVRTADGASYEAGQVLVAAGAFANCYGLLPEKLDLRIKSETILLAEVPPDEARRLREMPALSYAIDHPQLEDIYLVPPLLYPDGRYYAKMGCNTVFDAFYEALDEIRAWFLTGESDVVHEPLATAFLALFPDLRVAQTQTKRCIITYTTHGHPYIGQVGDNPLFVAVGGNGTGAHTSDAVGELAATMLVEGRFPADFAAPDFTVVYQ